VDVETANADAIQSAPSLCAVYENPTYDTNSNNTASEESKASPHPPPSVAAKSARFKATRFRFAFTILLAVLAVTALALAVVALEKQHELDTAHQTLAAMEAETANRTAALLRRPQFMRTSCEYFGGISSSGTFKYYEFKDEDCSPFFPTGDCDALLSKTLMGGGDQDWQALAPGKMSGVARGPAVANYCSGGDCNRMSVIVVFLCSV
jgi:hypothetical protein